MRPLILVLGLIASTLVGCANLLIEESDPPADKAGKVGARVLLGVTTLGISEVVMADRREAWEREQQLESYRMELARMVDAGELTRPEAEKFQDIARLETERRAALRAEQRRWAVGAIGATSPLGGQRTDSPLQSGYAPPQPTVTP
jgi:hypothetical protein